MDQMPGPRKRKSLNFEEIIKDGQNPKGFTAQVPAGTSKAGPKPGWNRDMHWEMPEVPADGAWTNANRTGE